MENFIVLDIETTGLSPDRNKITEIGAVKVINGKLVDSYKQLINPEVSIPQKITEITGISNQLVEKEPTIEQVMGDFLSFIKGFDIMGHNIMFDFSFLKTKAQKLGYSMDVKGVDTLSIAKKVHPELRSRSLTSLCEYYQISRDHAHRAYDDAFATYQLYVFMRKKFYTEENKNIFKSKPLHYKVKKNEPITTKQVKFLKALCKKYNVELEKTCEDFSKSEASRKIDHIINEYGRLY